MKKYACYYLIIFGILIFTACDRKNDTQATEKKQEGPVMELKDEIQAPKSDTTVINKDSTEKK